MDKRIAEAIADLINARNQLTVRYSAKKVLGAAERYICRFDRASALSGVVEVKQVQWYQCEIDHLSVREDLEGHGIASALVAEAEARARQLGARIAQCTIRVGNKDSERLFRKKGYMPTVTFSNVDSGNRATVYQKTLVAK
jgi:GNAT superfamily N-acetyltransferase